MGRYVTATSISVIMPGFLVGNTTTSDTAGVDVFSNAADMAEGELNALLVVDYDPSSWTTTGNPGIPPMVRAAAQDLTCYRALRASGAQDAQLKNLHLETYKPVLEFLQNLRDGKIALAFTDGSLVGKRTAQTYQSSTEGYTEIFGLDTDTAWKRDANESDDQSAARD